MLRTYTVCSTKWAQDYSDFNCDLTINKPYILLNGTVLATTWRKKFCFKHLRLFVVTSSTSFLNGTPYIFFLILVELLIL